ncbi:MAG: division/cell wall cluster transcriptional repressor MraZ [Polymorphobacter sp.]
MTAFFFHGYALNAVDAKNRLSVPSVFRDTNEKRSGEKQLIVGPAERAPCLVGYDILRFERLQAQLVERFAGNYSDERDDFARDAFGLNETLPYDETGRIILSNALKLSSGIDRLAFFIAAGDYFEIWNPERLIEQKGATSPVGRTVRQLIESRR